MLDNLQVFVTAAELGSLSSAADSLGMSLPTVSRRIIELEAKLGCDLFHRSNKGITLKSSGLMYFRECSGYIRELSTRLENLDRSLNSLEGTLSVSAPTNLGNGPLDAFWTSFVAEYPQISLSVQLVDPSDNSAAMSSDIGVQSGYHRKSAQVQDLVGTVTPVLVASPGLVFKPPTNIEELQEIRSVAADLFSQWTLVHSDGREVEISKRHAHTCNDMSFSVNLIRVGAGIGLLPLSLVEPDLRAGALVQILPEWSGVARSIYFVWPVQRTLSVRATRFRTRLTEYLNEQTWFTPRAE